MAPFLFELWELALPCQGYDCLLPPREERTALETLPWDKVCLPFRMLYATIRLIFLSQATAWGQLLGSVSRVTFDASSIPRCWTILWSGLCQNRRQQSARWNRILTRRRWSTLDRQCFQDCEFRGRRASFQSSKYRYSDLLVGHIIRTLTNESPSPKPYLNEQQVSGGLVNEGGEAQTPQAPRRIGTKVLWEHRRPQPSAHEESHGVDDDERKYRNLVLW